MKSNKFDSNNPLLFWELKNIALDLISLSNVCEDSKSFSEAARSINNIIEEIGPISRDKKGNELLQNIISYFELRAEELNEK